MTARWIEEKEAVLELSLSFCSPLCERWILHLSPHHLCCLTDHTVRSAIQPSLTVLPGNLIAARLSDQSSFKRWPRINSQHWQELQTHSVVCLPLVLLLQVWILTVNLQLQRETLNWLLSKKSDMSEGRSLHYFPQESNAGTFLSCLFCFSFLFAGTKWQQQPLEILPEIIQCLNIFKIQHVQLICQ